MISQGKGNVYAIHITNICMCMCIYIHSMTKSLDYNYERSLLYIYILRGVLDKLIKKRKKEDEDVIEGLKIRI